MILKYRQITVWQLQFAIGNSVVIKYYDYEVSDSDHDSELEHKVDTTKYWRLTPFPPYF